MSGSVRRVPDAVEADAAKDAVEADAAGDGADLHDTPAGRTDGAAAWGAWQAELEEAERQAAAELGAGSTEQQAAQALEPESEPDTESKQDAGPDTAPNSELGAAGPDTATQSGAESCTGPAQKPDGTGRQDAGKAQEAETAAKPESRPDTKKPRSRFRFGLPKFGRSKKQAPTPEPEPWIAHNIDYIGFRHGDSDTSNRAYGITSTERTHMAIFGLPGSGKSSILKLMVYQNIMRNQGFLAIDPHGELVRDIMEMVPPERHKDVIYVNPASLYRFGRTIQINPLEVKSENERYIAVMAFVNVLYNLYRDSWGPRLETVLRNAANALVESKEYNSLGNISEMITSESARDEILERVTSPNVKHFWKEIFAKQYSKDAGSSAYNKIDKILATPTVAAMFDCTESSISISDVIENRQMLLVDLSTGASDDIARFLGSIFLNMLYVEAKRRIDVQDADLEEARKNPFYAYVDEAHMFSNLTMSEMLRALRKFGVKVTLATQTCNAYDKDFANEIPGVCKTVITGRCDENTARLLRGIMPIQVEEMMQLPGHTFVMTTDEGSQPGKAVFRSRPVPFPGRRVAEWRGVARTSVVTWGKEVSLEKYMPTKVLGKLLFNPLECCIIHMLHFDQRDWYREEIQQGCKAVFPEIKEQQVSVAMDKLVRARFLKVMYPATDDGDQNETKKRWVIATKAYNLYLSQSAGGRRAGGEDHLDIIFKIMDHNMRRHRYCVPDLGDRGKDAPDLLIIEPKTLKDKTGYESYDPYNWSMKKLAVEVETDPTKHMEHSVYNYTKGLNTGSTVWFLCFQDRHREALEAAILEQYPEPKNLHIETIPAAKVIRGEAGIPDTGDEILAKVAVPEIPDVLKRITPGQQMPEHSDRIRQMGPANENARKRQAEQRRHDQRRREIEAQFARPDGSSDDVRSGRTAKPGTIKRSGVHMTELEYEVYQVIARDLGHRVDNEAILQKLGLNVPKKSVREAITNLLKKGAIVRRSMENVEKRGSLDGTGDRRTTKKVWVFAPNDEVPWPPKRPEDPFDHHRPVPGAGAAPEPESEPDVGPEPAPGPVPGSESEPDEEPAPDITYIEPDGSQDMPEPDVTPGPDAGPARPADADRPDTESGDSVQDDSESVYDRRAPRADGGFDWQNYTEEYLQGVLADKTMSGEHAAVRGVLKDRGIIPDP